MSGSVPATFLRRNLKWLVVIGVIAVAGGALGFALLRRGRSPWESKQAFDGDSTELKHTVIIATLDTPMPPGKNVIWCASFQVAWNRLKNDVIKEPIRIENAEEVCERLNKAKQSEADLPEGAYYAAAGFVKDGIIETIRKDMAARFPEVEPHEFDSAGDVIVAYAYLAANVKFTIPFFENEELFLFTDSRGRWTPVSSFGVRSEDSYGYRELRKQVRFLCYKSASRDVPNSQAEFAVDPCVGSSPNQIVLACIPPKSTLSETLEYLETNMSRFADEPPDWLREFGISQTLLVPNILYGIEHHFDQLEGPDKIILNAIGQGLYIHEASQMLRFRLDRSGAELRSEAVVTLQGEMAMVPPVFNRPFLIVMRKRGAEHPFFVMWVDNAELLCKR